MRTLKCEAGNDNVVKATSPKLVVMFIAMLGVSCTEGAGNREFVPVQETQSRIMTDMKELAVRPPNHYMQYNDVSGDMVEVAEFYGNDSQALVILANTGPGRVIDAHGLGSSTYIDSAFENSTIEWGEKGKIRVDNSDNYYQFFLLKENNIRCASFERQWEPEYADNRNRNASAALGFYCLARGLDEQQLERFLDSLMFR